MTGLANYDPATGTVISDENVGLTNGPATAIAVCHIDPVEILSHDILEDFR